jgi:hypothetical protein
MVYNLNVELMTPTLDKYTVMEPHRVVAPVKKIHTTNGIYLWKMLIT